MDIIDTASHRVQWHSTGFSLLEAKLEAIHAAKESVRMETYIYTDQDIGRRFRAALIAAAQRGVEVKLLVDALGGGSLPHDYFAELDAQPSGSMKWFNELKLSSWAFRDHRKLLVIDGQTTFVGGCNIDEDYHGDGVTHGWRDGGIRMDGPVAEEFEREFERQFATAAFQGWRASAARSVRKRRRSSKNAPNLKEVQPLFIRPGFGRNPLRDAVRQDLQSACDIAVTSAYFLPASSLIDQFRDAVRRGARMRLLLGGKSDVKLMQMATRSMFSRLLDYGIEVYEYQPQVLHAKMLVIDDAAYIGSSNLDPRSLRINFEVMARFEDGAVAERARRQFDDDLKLSSRVTHETCWDASWWERLGQMGARWILGRLDPRVAENMLRRIDKRV